MRQGPRRLAISALLTSTALLVVVAGCTRLEGLTATLDKVPSAVASLTSSREEASGPGPGTGGMTGDLPATTGSYPADNTLKIGFLAPLTGRLAGDGARQKIALNLALEDVNKSGGINGSSLDAVMLDDGAEPREDVILAKRLVNEDRVAAILGPLTSSGFEVAAPVSNGLATPMVSATSAEPGITDQNRPWTFRFAILESVAVPKAIEAYKRMYPNVKRMVVVADSTESINTYTANEVYPKALKDAGLQVIDTVPFDAGAPDFNAIVSYIRALNPDGIAYASLTPEAVAFAKELQRQGVDAPVVASIQNWGGQEVFLAKDAMEGWVVAGTFDEDTTDPRSRAYLDRFVNAGKADPAVGEPVYSGIWTNTYDAVLAMAQVMRSGGVASGMGVERVRTAIQDGLQNLKRFPGITGEISVLPNGDITAVPLPFVARNGKWVLVKE